MGKCLVAIIQPEMLLHISFSILLIVVLFLQGVWGGKMSGGHHSTLVLLQISFSILLIVVLFLRGVWGGKMSGGHHLTLSSML